MRVLFDTYAFRMQRVGGISRYFAELIRRLSSAGVDPVLFMPAVDNEHAASTGISSPTASRLLVKHRTARRIAHALDRRGDQLLMRFGRYDILHRTYYGGDGRSRRPSVCTIVDMIPELLPHYFRANPHQEKKQVALESQLLFSISECTSRDVAAVYGIASDRIVTTQLGIDPDAFRSPATSANPFRAPYLLFVGNRDGYKNFDRLARAVVPLMARDSTISLAVVGGGPLKERERALFAPHNLLHRVHQADVPDTALERIYREALVFVFPSEYEGFGIPLLEAFVAGCPVAASRASSFPEVGGDAIEYFDPTSVDEISHAIDGVISSSARAEALRTKGTARVPLFSWSRTVENTVRGYRQLA